MNRSGRGTAIVRSRLVCGLAMAGVAGASAFAFAQSAQVIRMEDDGSGAIPQIMHFSMPDFGDLRQPDFMPRDLPTFRERLVLSEAQTKVMEGLIAKYLEEFRALSLEKMPMPANGPMRIKLGPGGLGLNEEEGGEGDDREAVIFQIGDEMPDLDAMIEADPEMVELEQGMPGGMAVGVEVRMAAPGPDGEAPAVMPDGEEPGVAISFESANGEEIPEEVRKKLEEAATKMAEKMQQQIEQQMAEGGEFSDVSPMGEAKSIEQMQQENTELAAKAEDFRKAKAELRQQFVTNAQTNLIPEQIERWPSLERTLLRNKSLPKGRLAGERTDLVKVLGKIDMSESDREALAGSVETYEITLDSALKKRDEFVVTAHREVDRAMQNNDPDKALSVIDRATTLRLAVRSINDQFTQSLAAMMPTPVAQAFQLKVLEVSYPLIYRQTRGQKTFAIVEEMDEVSDETMLRINDLEKAYLAELNSLNGQIKQAIDKFEPDEPRRGIERTKRVMTGDETPSAVFVEPDGEGNPVRDAYARRRTLDDQYCKLVAELLTPEQAALLPKAPLRQSGQPIIIRKPIESD